jgi:hypothetical protein
MSHMEDVSNQLISTFTDMVNIGDINSVDEFLHINPHVLDYRNEVRKCEN